jgi:hypothetical protein
MENNSPHPIFSADWMVEQIEKCKPALFQELIAFKRYKNGKIIIQEDGEIKALTPDEFQLRVDVYLNQKRSTEDKI